MSQEILKKVSSSTQLAINEDYAKRQVQYIT